MKAWKVYQEEAAEFFCSLGLQASLEKPVEGARGKHKIDVWVTGQVLRIPFRWAVECKNWKQNVPKEKVEALIAICQDLGVDRGFLLSEVGFQSGAIRAAAKTNITLTSLADLRETSAEPLTDAVLSSVVSNIARLKTALHDLHRKKDEYFSEFSGPLGNVWFLEQAIADAYRGKFPTVYGEAKSGLLSAANVQELIEAARDIIAEANRWIADDSEVNEVHRCDGA